jgi:hypothetical protein
VSIGKLSRPAQMAGPGLTMPADTPSPPMQTSPRRDDGADSPGGDRGFHMYVIAMLALGDTVAAVFVLKAVYLLL